MFCVSPRQPALAVGWLATIAGWPVFARVLLPSVNSLPRVPRAPASHLQRCACRPTAAAWLRRTSSCPPSCCRPSRRRRATMRGTWRRLRSATRSTTSEWGSGAWLVVCSSRAVCPEQFEAVCPDRAGRVGCLECGSSRVAGRACGHTHVPETPSLPAAASLFLQLCRSSRLGSKVVLTKELDGAVIALGEVGRGSGVQLNP